jgi:hypothetical protein
MHRHPLERPEDFELNTDCQLAQGLVFAGFGRHTKTNRYHDSSVYGNHGTLTNMDPATDWVWSDELGRLVLDFDGISDFVKIPAFSAIVGPAITWSVWCKLGGENDVDIIMESSTYYNYYIGTFMCSAASSEIRCYLRVPEGYNGGTIVRPSTGAWFHLSVVQDTSLVKEKEVTPRINGTLVTFTQTHNDEGANFVSYDIYLGSREGSSLFTKMQQADLCIHNRPLSPAEIAILANRSDPMLSGLILPPKRRLWGVSLGGVTPAYRNLILGGGVL